MSAYAGNEMMAAKTNGPTRPISDLRVLEPDAETHEMTVVSIHPGMAPAGGDGTTISV